ncbi:MAG: T9SS type A sorting domain-containing protein [bacterium]|nr:T9SS type A sorting domain-containing protein [bacterium]
MSVNGSRNEIDAAFQLTDKNTFGITLPNGYNSDHSLRIDPLIYSTFLGGSGDDFGYDVINDDAHGIYVCGTTYSTDFPLTQGAIDTVNLGGDCFITRLNTTGTQLIFSTLLGGASWDYATCLSLDSIGNVSVAGTTLSSDYPTTSTALSRTFGGWSDGFITRINTTGSMLLFSTFLGGSNRDDINDITSIPDGSIFVTGKTSSSNFPTTTNAWCRFFIGGSGFPTWGGDCFITHINNIGTQLLYSTYFGGTLDEVSNSIQVGDNLEITITGWTNSENFPITPGVYDTTLFSDTTGLGQCFVSRLNSTGSTILFSTYLGNDSASVGDKILLDANNGVFVAGECKGDFPVTTAAYDTTFNGSGEYGGDVFIAHLSNNASQLLASTYLGGSNADQLQGLAKFSNGNLAVFGTTYSSNFPITTDAISTSLHGRTDCYLSLLDTDLSQLVYSTYLGGSGEEFALTMNKYQDKLFLTGGTSSTDFPYTTSGYDTTYNGGSADCFISMFRFDSTSVTQTGETSPAYYHLTQNYPNPFNSSTTISYSLPKPGHVDLRLFDITGREVATLVNQKQETGSYRVTFDGKNLSSGTYFVRMQAGEFIKTQKMVLLR